MRTDTIRTYKSLHTWTGIVTGLFLFVAFLGGAVSVFKPALERWGAPPPTAPLASLEEADLLAQRVLAAHPEARGYYTIHLGPPETLTARLSWQEDMHAQTRHEAELAGDSVRVAERPIGGLGRFLDTLHRTGGLPVEEEWGAAFMGVVSGLYLLALVSGIVVLVPSLIKDLFVLRLGSNLKRMWLDAHNLIGVVGLPFHVVIALTSLMFGLHDPIYDVLDRVVYDGKFRQLFMVEIPSSSIRPDPAPAAMLSTPELLARVEAAAPGFRPLALDFRNAGTQGASLTVWGDDQRYLLRGRGLMVMSPVTGAIVNTDYLPGHQGGYGPAVSAFFALHFASFGGPAVKWTYLALGLGGAFLFYSGNLLWIESRRRRERRDGGPVVQSRSTRWMAAVTLGVCLGTVAGMAVAATGSKWLHALGADADAGRGWLFYGTMLAALAWAFRRGPARAGGELTWAAAAAVATMPLTSALAALAPGLGVWAWPDAAGVDVVSALLALCLAVMARASSRRAQAGARDSVWSHVSDPAAG